MNTRNAATAAVLVLGGWITSGAFAADQPSAPGLWQKQEYSFLFMGFTTTYSCDGLADKLKLLLIAAGARRRQGVCRRVRLGSGSGGQVRQG